MMMFVFGLGLVFRTDLPLATNMIIYTELLPGKLRISRITVMEKEPYQDFLCRIAQQVDSLLIEDTSAIGRFRQHLQSSAIQHNKHMEWMDREEQKCFKKGIAFTVSSNMKVPPEYRSPCSMLVINPVTKHLPEPKSKEEEYQRYYIILASIHDNMLPEVERIDNSILPEEAADFIWNSLNKFYDSEHRRLFIEQALERVEAEKPAETEKKIKSQEKDGQNKGDKVDSTNKKSSETWLWKLYEKTIKAVIAAILDKINPS